jgi:hypothetical protein
LIAASLLAAPAAALDKQGSAHGGAVTGNDSGFGFSGSVGLGVSFYNPTYAARPDNTGKALMRYTVHADVDLIGRRLSIPLDINMFSDRERSGALKLAPTEIDFIGGLTSTWELGPGAIEFGARVETDRPVDRGTYNQTYVDARTRYLFALGGLIDGLSQSLGGGDITGAATLGVFAVNPTYAARPDNSGLALLRYAVRSEVSFWNHHAAVSFDATMFTDRETNGVQPTELDFTPALIARFEPWQLQVAYERDMPLDGRGNIPGYTQSFAYVLAEWAFDATPPAEPAAEPRENREDGTKAPAKDDAQGP